MCPKLKLSVAAFVWLLPGIVSAQDEATEAELAQQLANPVSSLISVPFQLNYDRDIGPFDDGDRYTLNIQPVIPLSINDNWNLISRTILPIVSQSDVFPGAGSQSGTGDVVQSFFFSPKAPTSSGWIWGAGPVLLVPTGSDDLLTADKWAAGPTGVALKQSGPWTYGALANHLWSFAGESSREDVSATFLQPFVSYATPSGVSYTANTEATYNWRSSDWQIPLNFVAGKVTRVGKQMMQFNAGIRYYAESTPGGAEGFGVRLVVILLFPK